MNPSIGLKTSFGRSGGCGDVFFLTVPLGLSDDPELLATDCGPGTSNPTFPLCIFKGAVLDVGTAMGFALGIFLETALGLALLERLRFRDGCGGASDEVRSSCARWMRQCSRIVDKYFWYKGSSSIARIRSTSSHVFCPSAKWVLIKCRTLFSL